MFCDNLNNKCQIVIIFGTVISQSIGHRKAVLVSPLHLLCATALPREFVERESCKFWPMQLFSLSKIGVTKPIFVDPGVKANSQYAAVMSWCLPAIKLVAGNMFAFQQDSALAPHARDIIQLQQPIDWVITVPKIISIGHFLFKLSQKTLSHGFFGDTVY